MSFRDRMRIIAGSARAMFGKMLRSLATSRFTAVFAFLVICALFLGTAWITGQKVGGPAAKALEELFIGWLPGSQISVIREAQEKVLLGSFQRGLIDLTRDGMKWLFVAITAISCIRWGRSCVKIIGSANNPAYGILARTGQAIRVLGPGGLVFFLQPLEALVQIPTSQYRMNYHLSEGLYSKEIKRVEAAEGVTGVEGRSPQPLEVRVGLYLSFPEVDREYDIPDGTGAASKAKGRDLLLRLFYKLPGSVNLWNAADGLGPFLEDAVKGAVREVLSQRHHDSARTEKKEIEKAIKDYLVSEIGNPFFELGIPPDCIDVELVSIKLRLEAENAFMAPELATSNAEAVKIQAEGQAKAAGSRRVAANQALLALTSAGVTPDVAAIVTSSDGGGAENRTGGAVGIGDLTSLAVLRWLGSSPPQPAAEQQVGGRRRRRRQNRRR